MALFQLLLNLSLCKLSQVGNFAYFLIFVCHQDVIVGAKYVYGFLLAGLVNVFDVLLPGLEEN